MSTPIPPDELRLDRSRFPFSLMWKKKLIATIYSTSLAEPLMTLVTSTAEINRLKREKGLLLDHIRKGVGGIDHIVYEPPISLSIGDEGVVTPTQGGLTTKIDIGSKWKSKRNGDLYEVISIDSTKGIVVISWLGGKYTREVTLSNLPKNYQSEEDVYDDDAEYPESIT